MALKIIAQRKLSTSKAQVSENAVFLAANLVDAVGVSASMHLDASVGIIKDNNNRVSIWSDQSGNGRHLTQTFATKQPLSKIGFNGLPCVFFDSTLRTDFLSGARPDDRNKTILLVYSYATGSGGYGMVAFGSTQQGSLGTYTNVDVHYIVNGFRDISRHVSGGAPPNTLNTTRLRILTCSPFPSTLSFTEKYSGFSFSSLFSSTQLNNPLSFSEVGMTSSSGALFSKSELFEVVVFDRILTTSELAKAESYINTKYGTL